MPKSIERTLDGALDKALAIQRPMVLSYLDRVRARRSDLSPQMVIEQLERRYLAAVAGIGAAAGGAAAVPGVGTATSIAAGAAEITAFVGATAMYVLALAELHGVPVGDPDVRRALVLGVLVGSGGEPVIETGELTTKHWAKVINRPDSAGRLGGINSRLGRLLVSRFGARQGALLIGRALPMGIGAGVGAVGNLALARAAISAARRAFGPAPASFPARVVEVKPLP